MRNWKSRCCRLLSHRKVTVKPEALGLLQDLYCYLDMGIKSGVRGTPLLRSATEARLFDSDSMARVAHSSKVWDEVPFPDDLEEEDTRPGGYVDDEEFYEASGDTNSGDEDGSTPEPVTVDSGITTYYRALVNFTNSFQYGPELDDIFSPAFQEISAAVVDTLESDYNKIQGTQTVNVVLIKNIGKDVFVELDVGSDNNPDEYQIRGVLYSVVEEGTIASYDISVVGFQFRRLGEAENLSPPEPIDVPVRPRDCLPEEFTCQDGGCVNLEYVCDNRPDCYDLSDEVDCFPRPFTPPTPPRTRPPPGLGPCRADQATCQNGQCISRDYICDGEQDCKDGSDELRCGTPSPCEPNEFKCQNGRCALKLWRCDGDNDCQDNSDESDCPTKGPGDTCAPEQFACLSDRTCIPASYQCDEEPDCPDRSDEYSCAPPTVTVPPEESITVSRGETVTFTCTAIGVPTPIITWRLNWGHLPTNNRVTMISENGRGKLTIRDVKEGDQGAYTCEAINAKGLVFAIPDGILSLSQRPNPGNCRDGHFSVGDHCMPCFCFGITKNCQSTGRYRSQIPLRFSEEEDFKGVNVTFPSRPGTPPPLSSTQMLISPETEEFQLVDLSRRFLDHDSFWSLPRQFLSNKVDSYGGYLKYKVSYSLQRGESEPKEKPDVVLSGNGLRFIYRRGDPTYPDIINHREIKFTEENWQHTSGGAVTRDDLMMLLANLESIQIRTIYDNRMASIGLSDISMDTTTKEYSLQGNPRDVEECRCPPGYSGLSCETCSPAFERVPGTYLGTCAGCNCNGHASACDPTSGHCLRCQHNTEGPQCNKCKLGYFGDPSRGRYDDCKPCPCPYTETSRRCAPGYVGNPLKPNGKCIPDSSPISKCDNRGTINPISRPCYCKANVVGTLCDECKSGAYHLSADNPDGCLQCFCMGVTKLCASSSWSRDQVRGGVNGQLFTLSNAANTRTISEGIIQRASTEIVYRSFSSIPNDIYYWVLPENFRGDKVTAYGGELRYQLYFELQTPSLVFDVQPDVVLQGNGIFLEYYSQIKPLPRVPATMTVSFRESAWRRSDGQPCTREHLLMTLADISVFMIRATYGDNMAESRIGNIQMDIAVPHSIGSERALEVEECACPQGYTGPSCQDCEVGYTRTPGLYLGTCEKCDCNGHASGCDSETGECLNCRHNTDGRHCENCLPGFYGNPKSGDAQACRPCPCLGQADNQRTCFADTDGQPTCECPAGYTGRRCESFTGCGDFFLEDAFFPPTCEDVFYPNPEKLLVVTDQDAKENHESKEYGLIATTHSRTTRSLSTTAHGMSHQRSPEAQQRSFQLLLRTNLNRFNQRLSMLESNTLVMKKSLETMKQKDRTLISQMKTLVRVLSPPDRTDRVNESAKKYANIETRLGKLEHRLEILIDSFTALAQEIDKVKRERRVSRPHKKASGIAPTTIPSLTTSREKNTSTGRPQRRTVSPKTFPAPHTISTLNEDSQSIRNSSKQSSSKRIQLNQEIKLRDCYRCDQSGSEGCSSTGVCRCKMNVEGSTCSICKQGTFHLSPSNKDGCLSCFCMGVTQQCSSSNHYRDVVSTTFTPGNHRGFALVNRQRTNRIDSGFSVEVSTEGTQLSYTNFNYLGQEPHYWQLPNNYQGDKHPADEARKLDDEIWAIISNVSNGRSPFFSSSSSQTPGDQSVRSGSSMHATSFHSGLTSSLTYSGSQSADPDQYYQPDSSEVETGKNTVGTLRGPRPGPSDKVVTSVHLSHWNVKAISEKTMLKFNRVIVEYVLVYNGFSLHQDDVLFWQLPEQFKGDKVGAYGGKLKYTISYVPGPRGSPIEDADVQIIGNDITLVARQLWRRSQGARESKSFEIIFREEHWQRPDGMPATREHLMMVLADLDDILIRASYHTEMRSSSISGIRMDIAVPLYTGLAQALEVEQCQCPPGYRGLSCQDCAAGYTRTGGGLYLGHCEPCECNGHSDSCQPESGICTNCQHNTKGELCEQCADGFFGDPTAGTPEDCQPCACPGTDPDNQFSRTCESLGNGGYQCTACQPGYTGQYCERCASGYVGNPQARVPCRSEAASLVVKVFPERVQVAQGSPVTLRCQVSGYPPHYFYWSLEDGRPISSTVERRRQGEELHFPSVHPSDAGVYICTCRDQHSTNRSKAEIIVTTLPSKPIEVFIEEPKTQSVTAGATVSFICTAKSKLPAYTLVWTRRGNGKLPNHAMDFNGILTIQNVKPEDAGIYVCTGSNMLGMDEGSALLYVPAAEGVRPVASINPPVLTVHQGQRAEFRCTGSGNPTPAVEWTGGPGNRISPRAVIRNGLLTIPSVERSDEGEYICKALNTHGEHTARGVLHVQSTNQANGLPLVQVSPPSVEIHEGETLRLYCRAVGSPTPGLKWKKRGGSLPPQAISSHGFLQFKSNSLDVLQRRIAELKAREERTDTGTLLIPNIRSSDAGTYLCVGTNTVGSSEAYIEVFVKRGEIIPSGVTIQPSIASVAEGETLDLNCIVPGTSLATVKWSQAGGLLSSNHQVLGTRLRILQASSDDSGEYICHVENGPSSYHASVSVSVTSSASRLQSPIISIEPHTAAVKQGDSASFRCRVHSGAPPVRLEWKPTNNQALPDNVKTSPDNSVITFSNAQAKNQGTYRCVASNLFGITHSIVSLIVKESPKAVVTPTGPVRVRVGDPINLECQAAGEPRPSVRWHRLDNNRRTILSSPVPADSNAVMQILVARPEDTGTYVCTAQNNQGTTETRIEVLVEGGGQIPTVPRASVREPMIVVVEGSTAVLHCDANGFPKPTITWSKERSSLPWRHKIVDNSLVLTNVGRQDSGQYVCNASNHMGISEVTVMLEVDKVTLYDA
ncbi:Basement membrane-specific heparan sulfate proteoglycan core protein [Triplophysa tibetana]|uniref:Basement membrane-specific heparan sulfate proteoglycan core protein n=1 Tax=Triplophysa tibetana TaxID=1572043 RepID=A0A5A9NDL4_9TELE|nr:Basement membrane-specific heparan sulfate proteoglycan core protein [Triplophysa tibetana]